MNRAFFIIVILLLAPNFVHAQSKADLREFELQLKLATTAFDEGRFDDAIKSFTRASEIVDHPRLQLQIAWSHLKLNQCSAAKGVLDSLEENTLDAEIQADVDARRKDLQLCVGNGELRVLCDTGVNLLVNGEPQVCGVTTPMKAGEHTVQATSPGYLPFETTALVQENLVTDVAVNFQEEPQPIITVSNDPMPWDIIGLAAAGVGVGLIGIGVVDDMTTTSARLDDMRAAAAAGDQSRFEALESEGDGFAVRPVLLVSVGGALVVGGLATWYLSRTDESSVAIRLKTDSIEAAITW